MLSQLAVILRGIGGDGTRVGTEPDPKATIEKCSGETRAGTEPDPSVAIMMNHNNITIRLGYGNVTIFKWRGNISIQSE